jgi:hypothetical protein
MKEERWAFRTAGAVAAVDGDIGVVAVRGMVCNEVLEALKLRIATWARRRSLAGCVLRLGWQVVLTANGPGELLACLRGASAPDGVPALRIALLVPPERERWATKHCEQIGRHGLPRAAFVDPAAAIAWARLPVKLPSRAARSSGAVPEATGPSSSRRPAVRAGRRTPPQAGTPGTLAA